jgi:CheY-like chemotaxis protein
MSVILCIDDDRDVRNLLEKILTGAGYTVTAAGDGRQGLIEARKRTGSAYVHSCKLIR